MATRWVVVITAADGTVTVSGAFYDIIIATAMAVKVEQLVDGSEACIRQLASPVSVMREIRG